jgi:hypothetical protein
MNEYRIVKKEIIRAKVVNEVAFHIQRKCLWFWIPTFEYFLNSHDLDYNTHHSNKPRSIAFVGRFLSKYKTLEECNRHLENIKNPCVEYYHHYKLIKIIRHGNQDIFISKYYGSLGFWSIDRKYGFEYSADIDLLKNEIDKMLKPKRISTFIY